MCASVRDQVLRTLRNYSTSVWSTGEREEDERVHKTGFH